MREAADRALPLKGLVGRFLPGHVGFRIVTALTYQSLFDRKSKWLVVFRGGARRLEKVLTVFLSVYDAL